MLNPSGYAEDLFRCDFDNFRRGGRTRVPAGVFVGVLLMKIVVTLRALAEALRSGLAKNNRI